MPAISTLSAVPDDVLITGIHCIIITIYGYKYLGPFKRYVTLRGEGGISRNVTERDRGGRGFALALRNAGMSA